MSVIGTDCSIIGFGLEAKREETSRPAGSGRLLTAHLFYFFVSINIVFLGAPLTK
jgi:hypothetical protein